MDGRGGVNLDNMRALQTWMSVDDMLDALEAKEQVASWDAAIQANALPPPGSA